MATITGKSLIDQVLATLQDVSGVRWSRTELLGYLNDGQREVVLLRPEACVTNAAFELAAGVAQQTLPSAALALVDLTHNLGGDGLTPGRAIRIVSREVLDAQSPDWRATRNTGETIEHYMYDPRDPKTFYVYPKAPDTTCYVALVYASVPLATDDAAKVIGVADIYANALTDYVLYRAYSKDAEYAQNAQLAVAYYSAFANALGVRLANSQSRNPNLSTAPFNPTVPGSAKI